MLKFFRASVLALAGALLHPAAPHAQQLFDAAAIMHQPSRGNICAITFDDGPTAFTGQLLDSLRDEGVHATFFVLGQRIRQRRAVVRRMAEEGHEVANHSYSHPNMRKISQAARRFELEQSNNALQELGIVPRYFRPPYGKYDAALTDMAASMGMSVVMWTTDSRDWRRRPVDYRNLPTFTGRRMRPDEMRGVFLFHDTQLATVQDVKRIVRDLRGEGCRRFVTVSEFFNSLPLEMPPLDAPLTAASPETLASESPVAAQTPFAPEAAAPPHRLPVPLARGSRWLWPTLFRGGG